MAQALSNLPIGAKIKFGKHRVNTESPEPIIWVIADKNHSGYPTDSVNLITEKIIDLRAVDAMENVSDDGSDFDVDTYYPSSNIHRWLNESSTSWYAKAHSDDKPPKNEYITYGTGYYDKPGFLYNFTEEERLAILPMSFPLGSGYYLNAKIVIPLLSEIMGVSSVDNSGTQFAYFATRGFACNLTSQAYTNTLSTNKPTTVAQNWLYATRNAAYNDMYGISNTGARTNYSTYDGSVGLRPVTNLSSYTKMSDEVDSDGCYNILSQVAPIISGTNSDIGIKTAPFSQTYTVTDADNDIVTVREYVDNVEIRSYVATLGSDSNFVVSGETWLKLTNGVHTLKIVATY